NMEKMSALNHYCKLEVNDTKLTFTVKSSAGAVIETFDYNLAQTDVKDLVQNKLNESFDVYSVDHTVLLTNKRNMVGSYLVYDNWGKEVLKNNFSSISTNLNLKKHGIYFVRILAEGTFIVKKIVVGKD
ncbi:MAG: T9SS type A sorting domain-containing protein, partial [Bacteroidia bacterium]|nr:T9SS type A sorting domain-containing protein [Bacteroidia bacterium]